jgi:phage terminase large subunit-like protein
MPRDFQLISDQYIADVKSGAVPACKWVRLACQRQSDELLLQGTEDFPYTYDPDKGIRACKFIEKLPHIAGFHGRVVLEPWQVFIVMTVFSWLRAGTRWRRFRREYTEIPRGNGKSLLMAAIGLYLAFMDDEPGAEVYVAAVSKDQTKHVFELAAQPMALRTPEFRKRYGVEVSAHSITQLSTTSFFRALASKTNTLDSLNIHFGIIDELHAHPSREVYESLDTGTGKRDNSMLWCITTAGSDRSGICYDRRAYICNILEKKVRADTWFGIIYTIDDDDDWATEEALKKANPNWGVSVKPDDVMGKLKEAMTQASAAPNFKTKHLNVWVGADHAWMDLIRWNKCADAKLNEDTFSGQNSVIGLDLASKLDLLAGMKIFWEDKDTEVTDHKTGETSVEMKRHYYVFGSYWTNEENIANSKNASYAGWKADGRLEVCPGSTNNYNTVEDWIKDTAKLYQVLEVAHDPYQAVELVNHLTEEGITMVEIPQMPKYLSEPMKELEAAVYDGRFHFDGDPVLTWAISNVVAHADKNDNLFPNKERPENKIDPATALLTGLNRVMVQASTTSEDGVVNFGNCRKCGVLSIGVLKNGSYIYLCPDHQSA